MARLGSWIEPFPEGIYVKPADAWVDPSQPKPKALVTHGHADHARGGHGAVWATPQTLAIMGVRYGEQQERPVAYGETIRVGEVDVSFVPAGHVLGSAQIVLEYQGERVVVTGTSRAQMQGQFLPAHRLDRRRAPRKLSGRQRSKKKGCSDH